MLQSNKWGLWFNGKTPRSHRGNAGSIPTGSTMTPKQIGILGEKIACNYLKKKGYQILDKNYVFRISRSPQKGEIDIIAKRDDTISFIEIKALRDSPRGTVPHFRGEDKVDFFKRRKIIKTAESWLRERKIPFSIKRQIDVISIIIDLNSKKAKIRHFKNV